MLPHIIEHNAPRLRSRALLAQLSGPKMIDSLIEILKHKKRRLLASLFMFCDPMGNRTPVIWMKTRCPNH